MSANEEVTDSKIKYNWTGRNRCIIFDQRNFNEGLNVKPRNKQTATRDLDNFKDLFNKLGFQVIVRTDKTRKELTTIIVDEGKNPKLPHLSGIVVVVLSIGKKDYFLAKDGLFKLDWVWGPLILAPELIAKPKLFFFQVEEVDFEPVATECETDGPSANDLTKLTQIPQADFCYVHYHIPNPLMNTVDECCFSKILCDIFTKEATSRKHFLDLMTTVNGRFRKAFDESKKGKAETKSAVGEEESGKGYDPPAQFKLVFPKTVSHFTKLLFLS